MDLRASSSDDLRPPVPPPSVYQPATGDLQPMPDEQPMQPGVTPAVTPASPAPGGSIMVRSIQVVSGVPAAATVTVSTP